MSDEVQEQKSSPLRSNWGAALGGVAVALGLAAAGAQIGGSLIEMRQAGRVVTVKGLAERDVEADLASWRLPFRGVGDTRQTALAEATSAQRAIRAFAVRGDLAESDLSDESFSMRIERSVLNDGGRQIERERFVVTSALRVRSRNVAAVTALTTRTGDLLDAGVLLGANDFDETARPEYLFTGLNEVKPALIAEATQAARASAAQFANDSGARVGDIASANQGVIQILARDGQFDERFERNKKIRVVSTVRYYLAE